MEKVVDQRIISQQEWLEYRRSGIGGSDAGAIAGLNPWKSRLCVYFDKIGEATVSADIEGSEAMYWGTRLEDIIASEFSRRSGFEVEPCHYMLKSSEHPFMLANPDRLIVDNEEGLECKTANAFTKDQWEDDNIPEIYMAQIQHYMAVTGYEGWYIAVLIGGNYFKYQYIERDDEYIDRLIQLESDFWLKHVVPKVMPDVDGASATTSLIKRMFPKAYEDSSISLNSEINTIINNYIDYSERESEYSSLREECSNKLKMMLGDNEKGATDSYLVNWQSVNLNRFNAKSFAKNQPELFKQYSQRSSYRRFSVKAL